MRIYENNSDASNGHDYIILQYMDLPPMESKNPKKRLQIGRSRIIQTKMDEIEKTSRMLDWLANAAKLEESPPLLDVNELMVCIRSEELSEDEAGTINWPFLTAIGATVAVAAIILLIAYGAWYDLHDPFVDLKQYVEFIA